MSIPSSSSSSILQAKIVGCYHILPSNFIFFYLHTKTIKYPCFSISSTLYIFIPTFLYRVLSYSLYIFIPAFLYHVLCYSLYIRIYSYYPSLFKYLSLYTLYIVHIYPYYSVSFTLYIFILTFLYPSHIYPYCFVSWSIRRNRRKKGRCVLSVSTPLIRTRELAAMFICSTYEHSLTPSGFHSLPRLFHRVS